MLRLWAKMYKDNHLLCDMVACAAQEDTRTHKIFAALYEVCDAWNLAHPIWLDANISEFKKRSRTRFKQDNFIETIDFDYLEIQIIEE